MIYRVFSAILLQAIFENKIESMPLNNADMATLGCSASLKA
jgi:hypothetical protein